MAKKKKRPTKESRQVEKSEEILVEVKNKPSKEDKAKAKEEKLKAKQKAKAKQQQEKPKRHRVKEVFSELKKVNWPTFKKTCKQTGTVLIVVVIFMLVVLGIDSLLAWLMSFVV